MLPSSDPETESYNRTSSPIAARMCGGGDSASWRIPIPTQISSPVSIMTEDFVPTACSSVLEWLEWLAMTMLFPMPDLEEPPPPQ
eukprot:CAMPEP_0195516088 /NCGR_PEP_ID=MMETSP0794_2-20130614/6929_1 /TAXON_ID=515487 /ORGANISM="Stephanopyxis turris, Strain CCMP 815" /LENGTH=84 /DNA_ID=CAMNT_0040644605 /DNA_START=100 /DNA_END=354 /DNA_ORIENTATION=+